VIDENGNSVSDDAGETIVERDVKIPAIQPDATGDDI
jgi:hypothetical protein